MFNVKMSSRNTIQGGIFLNNKNKYNQKNIKLIEGNQNMNNPDESKIDKLVQEYRGLVDRYEMNYEQFVYEKMNTDSNISELFGKVVQYPKDSTGKLYFVTQRGVRREIPRTGNNDNLVSKFIETAKYKSHECSATPIKINGTQFRALREGLPLQYEFNSQFGYNSQKCNDSWVIEGSKLLRDRVSDNIGWIDDLGNLYQFSDPNNKHSSCGDKIEILNGQEWSLLKHKTKKLTSADMCPSQTQPLQIQLNKDNQRMLDIAREIKMIVTDMQYNNTGKDEDIKVGTNNFNREKDRLLKKRQKIKALEKEIYALNGNIRDNTFGVKSVNLNYLAWGVSFVTIAGICFMISKK